jgi:hypothetical protein
MGQSISMGTWIIISISAKDTKAAFRPAASVPPNTAERFTARLCMILMAMKLPANASKQVFRRYRE